MGKKETYTLSEKKYKNLSIYKEKVQSCDIGPKEFGLSKLRFCILNSIIVPSK